MNRNSQIVLVISMVFKNTTPTRHTFTLSQKKWRENPQKLPKISDPPCKISLVCVPCFPALMFLRHIWKWLFGFLVPHPSWTVSVLLWYLIVLTCYQQPFREFRQVTSLVHCSQDQVRYNRLLSNAIKVILTIYEYVKFDQLPSWIFLKGSAHDFRSKFQISPNFVFGQTGPGNNVLWCLRVKSK